MAGRASALSSPRSLHPIRYRAEEASRRIATVPGLVDVNADVNINSPEYQVQLDRKRASDLGVRAADLGNALVKRVESVQSVDEEQEGEDGDHAEDDGRGPTQGIRPRLPIPGHRSNLARQTLPASGFSPASPRPAPAVLGAW